MKKFICDICHYEYDPAKGDPDNGIAPGTAFEDLPADWVCFLYYSVHVCYPVVHLTE